MIDSFKSETANQFQYCMCVYVCVCELNVNLGRESIHAQTYCHRKSHDRSYWNTICIYLSYRQRIFFVSNDFFPLSLSLSLEEHLIPFMCCAIAYRTKQKEIQIYIKRNILFSFSKFYLQIMRLIQFTIPRRK